MSAITTVAPATMTATRRHPVRRAAVTSGAVAAATAPVAAAIIVPSLARRIRA